MLQEAAQISLAVTRLSSTIDKRSIIITGKEFERWMMLLDEGKVAPQKARSILADSRLFPALDSGDADKQPGSKSTFTVIRQLVVASLDVCVELKPKDIEQLRVCLRYPSPLLYEALWLIMATLIRMPAKSDEYKYDPKRVLTRTKLLQDVKMHENAISLAIEGFPSGKFEPRRAAMLYIAALADHSPRTIMSLYPKFIPFLFESMSDDSMDSVIVTLSVQIFSSMLEVPSSNPTILDCARLFEDSISLLSKKCTSEFGQGLESGEAGSFLQLIKHSRIEILKLLKLLIKKDEVKDKTMNDCDRLLWILSHPTSDEEFVTALNLITYLLSKHFIGFNVSKKLISIVLEQLNSEESSELVQYSCLQAVKSCLSRFELNLMWPVMYGENASILSDLSDLLGHNHIDFTELSMLLLRNLTYITDDEAYSSVPHASARKRRATLGDTLNKVGEPSRPRSSFAAKRASVAPRPSILPTATVFPPPKSSTAYTGPPDPRPIVMSLAIRHVVALVEKFSHWPTTLIHDALCLICNLSVHDMTAQQLASQKGFIKAITDIFIESRPRVARKPRTAVSQANLLYSMKKSTSLGSFARLNGSTSSMNSTVDVKHLANPTLVVDCLCCLRNLCIDEASCLEILDRGSRHILRLLTESAANSEAYKVALAVLRNLALQNNACLRRLMFGEDSEEPEKHVSDETHFVEEVVVALSTNEPDGQQCALDIVEKIIMDGGTDAKKALLDAGCLSALLVPMSSGSVNAEKAVKCFTDLQGFQKQGLQHGVDIWSRLQASWKAQDAELRTAKGNVGLRQKGGTLRSEKRQRKTARKSSSAFQ
ncbi:hypothetical protein BC830DRAFT_1119799 [Chytriomyces sp. MP71]|nr:hypothetical protein BC830DRAFT_1119799 [Chytriomyces sp. MP71]